MQLIFGEELLNVNKLQVLQNRVARIILNENYDTSSHVLLNRLMLVSVRQRYAYQTYILLFKVFHNIVPANLNCFVLNENLYNYRASTKSLLKVPHPRTNIMKTSLHIMVLCYGIIFQLI